MKKGKHMTYTKFDKKTCRQFREELQALLDKHGMTGLEFEVGNMRYFATEVEVKLKAKVAGVDSQAEKLVKSYASMEGMVIEKNHLRLVEYKTRNHKYPWIYLDTRDGKRYKCSRSQAKMLFAA